MGNKSSSSSRRKSQGSTEFEVRSKVTTSTDIPDGSRPRIITRSSAIPPATKDKSSTKDTKLKSCPDLVQSAQSGTAAADNSRQDADIKVYRSYTNVAEASRRSSYTRPDIRVYKRNTGGKPSGRWYNGATTTTQLAAEYSQTLPRTFGRSRSLATTPTDETSLTLPRGRSLSGQSDLKRHSATGFVSSSGFGELRSSRRTSSTCSMASIGYKVNIEDFPDTATIKRRLAQFETVFTRSLSQLFSSLAQSVQLSTLSIAIRPDRANQHISLWQYLNSTDIPVDLLALDWQQDGDMETRYQLTIQPAMFSGVMHLRRDRAGDMQAAVSLAGELVACLAAEAATELSRIFEYQLALLSEGLTIDLVAGHAAHCVLEFMKRTGRCLDRNTIIHGVLRGEHGTVNPTISPRLSVIIGQRELKWQLDEIFRKPALRKETFLFTSEVQVDEDHSPWQFFSSYYHDPMLYGYRALVIDWDYTSTTSTTGLPGYRLNGEDEASFPDLVDWRPDDFHRTYLPYRRLVGAAVIDQFMRSGQVGTDHVQSTSLAEFVNRLQGEWYSRDVIQVIYRQIGGATVTNRITPELDDTFVTSTSHCVTADTASDDVRRLVARQHQASLPVEHYSLPVMTSPATTEVIVSDLVKQREVIRQTEHNDTIRTPPIGNHAKPEIVPEHEIEIVNLNVSSGNSDDIIVVLAYDDPIKLPAELRERSHVIHDGMPLKNKDSRVIPMHDDVRLRGDDAGYFLCESSRRTIRSDL